MATRGTKPKPAALKLVQGNPGKRAIDPAEVEMRESPLEPPKKLLKTQKQLWDKYIETAWWLTEHDAPKAFMWVALQAEFQKDPAGMVASRISNLRALGAELGLDPSARARLAMSPPGGKDPAEGYF